MTRKQSAVLLKSILSKSKSKSVISLDTMDRAIRDNQLQSLIGKIETGDRRLDIVEMIDYAHALEVDPRTVIDLILNQKKT